MTTFLISCGVFVAGTALLVVFAAVMSSIVR